MSSVRSLSCQSLFRRQYFCHYHGLCVRTANRFLRRFDLVVDDSLEEPRVWVSTSHPQCRPRHLPFSSLFVGRHSPPLSPQHTQLINDHNSYTFRDIETARSLSHRKCPSSTSLSNTFYHNHSLHMCTTIAQFFFSKVVDRSVSSHHQGFRCFLFCYRSGKIRASHLPSIRQEALQ